MTEAEPRMASSEHEDAAAQDRDPPRPNQAPDRDQKARGAPDEAATEPHDPPAEDAAKDGHGEPPPLPSKWPFLIVGAVTLGLVGWSAYGHWQQHAAAVATADQTVHAVPEVQSVEAKLQDKPIDLTLPAATEPFDTANLYPRATGYVAERRVDIGSRVRKGDLLLHITAPDLDQQLAQAEAQLGQVQAALAQAQAQVGQAQANLDLAKLTYGRTRTLTKQGYETFQNEDNQQANLTSQTANLTSARAGVTVAEANIKSQQATVDRLKALAAFEDVRAPFAGVVTARNVDVGDLLNADSSSGAPMFTVARDDVMRVAVAIPQNAAIGVHDGLDATVSVPQMPERVFKGKVARSTVALMAASRSLTAEIDVPNPDGQLRPGLYALVHIAIPQAQPRVEVPAEALIFNQHGMQVAVLEQDSQIRMQPVSIARDLGTSVELRDGLKGGEQVVVSPPATLEPGSKVKAAPQQPAGKPGQAPPGQQATPGQKAPQARQTVPRDEGKDGQDQQAKADSQHS